MKLYLASSFKNIPLVEQVAEALEAKGHEITEKWWSRPYEIEGLGEIDTQELKKKHDSLADDDFYKIPTVASSFSLDLAGVETADALLVVGTETPRKYNGASVELGIAIGHRKHVAVLGKLETSVLFYPLERLSTILQVLEWVEECEADLP